MSDLFDIGIKADCADWKRPCRRPHDTPWIRLMIWDTDVTASEALERCRRFWRTIATAEGYGYYILLRSTTILLQAKTFGLGIGLAAQCFGRTWPWPSTYITARNLGIDICAFLQRLSVIFFAEDNKTSL